MVGCPGRELREDVATPVEDALTFSGSAGGYVLEVDDRWEARPGNVFGGFVFAVAVRSAGLVGTAARPLSISCQFLRPAKVGLPIEATVVSMRRGRTNELLAVTLEQAGKTVTEAHVRAVDGGSGPAFDPARGDEREQIKWFLYAGIIVITGITVEIVLGVPITIASWLGGMVVPFAIAVALQVPLYDLDRLINRTLVYGLLTALLAGIYAGVVLVLGQVSAR